MFGLLKKTKKDSPLIDAVYREVNLFDQNHLVIKHMVTLAHQSISKERLLKDSEKKNILCGFAINFCMSGSSGLDLGEYETFNSTRGLNMSDDVVNAILELSNDEYSEFVNFLYQEDCG